MNSKLSQVATVKAYHLSGRLCQRIDKKSNVALQDWLTWFEVIGYTIQSDSDIRKEWVEESSDFRGILRDRLYKALKQINSKVSADVLQKAISQIVGIQSDNRNIFESNKIFHQYLTEGIDIVYRDNDQIVSEKVWLIDPSNLLNNDWLVTYSENPIERRLIRCWDTLVFINGLPLALIVCTDTSSRYTTLKQVYQKFQADKQQNPKWLAYNEFLAIACGGRARIGTLTSDWEEFQPWRTVDGESFSHKEETELEILIQGIFDKRRFTELLKHFIIFERNGTIINKQLRCYSFCTVPHPKVIGL
ncbi:MULTISPECIES: type I restriction endonuclease [Nostocales]|uniref:type I site-specific deoxyribonuclease n=3 Tax=Nostocales TaxID=1161 RepID=A0A8S9TBY6_9CYAN|nr:type I restriction endonuclease [Tolypothrix bouteillei]KAF3889915.1 type I restriction endonuclease subunit R [Tolypothrix bouteillei VB521301]